MMFGQVYSPVKRLRACKMYWQDKVCFSHGQIQILLKYWILGVFNAYVNDFLFVMFSTKFLLAVKHCAGN